MSGPKSSKPKTRSLGVARLHTARVHRRRTGVHQPRGSLARHPDPCGRSHRRVRAGGWETLRARGKHRGAIAALARRSGGVSPSELGMLVLAFQPNQSVLCFPSHPFPAFGPSPIGSSRPSTVPSSQPFLADVLRSARRGSSPRSRAVARLGTVVRVVAEVRHSSRDAG